jgi:hypothetical protein
MRLLLLLALALPSASAALPASGASRPQASTRAPDCRADLRLRSAQRRGGPAKLTPLGEEPSAAIILTVYREVGGCPEPAIVRTGLGR